MTFPSATRPAAPVQTQPSFPKAARRTERLYLSAANLVTQP